MTAGTFIVVTLVAKGTTNSNRRLPKHLSLFIRVRGRGGWSKTVGLRTCAWRKAKMGSLARASLLYITVKGAVRTAGDAQLPQAQDNGGYADDGR